MNDKEIDPSDIGLKIYWERVKRPKPNLHGRGLVGVNGLTSSKEKGVRDKSMGKNKEVTWMVFDFNGKQ